MSAARGLIVEQILVGPTRWGKTIHPDALLPEVFDDPAKVLGAGKPNRPRTPLEVEPEALTGLKQFVAGVLVELAQRNCGFDHGDGVMRIRLERVGLGLEQKFAAKAPSSSFGNDRELVNHEDLASQSQRGIPLPLRKKMFDIRGAVRTKHRTREFRTFPWDDEHLGGYVYLGIANPVWDRECGGIIQLLLEEPVDFFAVQVRTHRHNLFAHKRNRIEPVAS